MANDRTRRLRGNAAKRSAWLSPGGPDGEKVSPGRRKPGETVYRYPQWVQRQGLVVGAIFGLMAVAIVVVIAIAAVRSARGEDVSDEFITWGASIAFIGPITLAAMFGGLTLNRYGWIVGLGFGVGFLLLVVGSTQGDTTLSVSGGVALVGSVLLFFVIGAIRRVPMWIGGRSGPRQTVSDGLADGEVAPGVLPDQESGPRHERA